MGTFLGIVLFFGTFITSSIWYTIAYIEYGYQYRVLRNLPGQSRWDVFMGSGYQWGIIFERQPDPILERLRRRAHARFFATLIFTGIAMVVAVRMLPAPAPKAR